MGTAYLELPRIDQVNNCMLKLLLIPIALAGLAFAPFSCFAQTSEKLKTNPSVSATSHVLWLKGDGSVWAAGEDNDGARGDADPDEFRRTFQKISGLPPMIQVCTCDNESAALSADGTVWIWGMFDNFEPYSQPKKIPGLNDVQQIALGSDFLVALRKDGSVIVAGSDKNGLRGPSGKANPTAFSEIRLGTDNIGVGASLDTAFAVKKDGTVWGWGSKFGALLGKTSNWSFLNRESDPTPIPVRVEGLKNIRAVEGGHHHMLALSESGDVYAWGDNEDGSLGFPRVMGFAETYYQYPGKVRGLPKVINISAGYDTSLAVDETGGIWAWGSNVYGCLGVDEDFEEGAVTPAKIMSIREPAISVTAGDYHAFATLKDGSVFGWGMNAPSESFLPSKTQTEFIPPVRLSGPR